MTERILYPLTDAAAAVGQSERTLRRAIHATDPAAFPPPLRAKRDGRGRYLITHAELERWANSLEDA